jgi:topoisomerase-4 subunit A
MSEEKNTGKKRREDKLVLLKNMYDEYFLDYASYVILERAVPSIEDGLKPVQRRILHSLFEKEDGRFHKVANIIGHTMQYHPHGDAAIGDALVNLGQKNLLIDTQGNWGDARTGDSAAAPRYIETRLTPFAIDVAFNKKTTDWQPSYDGRNSEPVNLPMKFPLVLAQGVEGIAVGLSTRIMPHNFIEIIKASIKYLQEKSFTLYPDFETGGMIDISDYRDGARGGKVKIRAKIEQPDKKNLSITELPYGVTTESMIDSILKANDKGKIKIKHVSDNTAKDVDISIELLPGTSPDITMDALYAFTYCEVSVSPNACVIRDNKPHFLTVSEILKHNVDRTRHLLGRELEIKRDELEEKWLFASLEKIFIGQRIYRDIEECESWDEVLVAVETGLNKFVVTPDNKKATEKKLLTLHRNITTEDITRLTEIRIKRISKYNEFKANDLIKSLEEELEETRRHLAALTDFTIEYFRTLLKKYGKGRDRKTEIISFDTINAKMVVANNARLYVNRKGGFVGFGLKKDEFVRECSDIDDLIVILEDGTYKVTRIQEKNFIGKNIIHVDVWKQGDERTTYHAIYTDGKGGVTRAKRFQVKAVTRDTFYDITKGEKGSKLQYFSANPNGEAELVNVTLSQNSKARKKVFEFDFSELAIKGRRSQGNIVTKHPIRKIVLKEIGKSTLGALNFWLDNVSGKVNKMEIGKPLGEFDTGDLLMIIYKDGTYELKEISTTLRIDIAKTVIVEKLDDDTVITAIYYGGSKKRTMVKRFKIETKSTDQRFSFISEHPQSELLFASVHPEPHIRYKSKIGRKKLEGDSELAKFIEVKGWKAFGNMLSNSKITSIEDISPEIVVEETNIKEEEKEQPFAKEAVAETSMEKREPEPMKEEDTPLEKSKPTPKAKPPKANKNKIDKPKPQKKDNDDEDDKIKPGDTFGFEIDPDGQGRLF